MPANVKGSSPEDKRSHELADLRASYHEIRHELTDHVRRLWARIEELEALGPAGRHELLSQLTRSAPPTSPAQKDFS
jgi:hypothetical protein